LIISVLNCFLRSKTKKLVLSFFLTICFLQQNSFAQTEKLYHTEFQGTRVFNSDTNGANLENIATNGTGLLDIEVDKANGYIYWSAFTSNEIWRAKLDGSDPVLLYTTATQPYGLDIDPANNVIMWGHWGQRTIQCAALDGTTTAPATVLTKDHSISDVEFDLTNNKIYYGNGNGGIIGVYQTDYAGDCSALTGDTLLVPDTGRVYGIVLDIPNDTFYWTNPSVADVSSANLDGTGVVNGWCSGGSPAGNWLTGIDLIDDTLYWNAFGSDRTYSSGTAACSVSTFNTSTLNNPWGLAAVEFDPEITLEKLTDGNDADTGPGQNLVDGDPVTWRYEVENTGDTVLDDITVSDSDVGSVTNFVSGDANGDDLLNPGEKWIYTKGMQVVVSHLL